MTHTSMTWRMRRRLLMEERDKPSLAGDPGDSPARLAAQFPRFGRI